MFFLTNQQSSIKKDILEKNNDFYYISGKAGTGKTLLLYDLIKSFPFSLSEIFIFHCGFLNKGQHFLKANGYQIYPIKDLINIINQKCPKIIAIDESQRMREDQFNFIIEYVNKHKISCIFCFDENQTLSDDEIKSNISSKIKNINGIEKYELSNKIRTNIELSSFIINFFDLSKKNSIIQYHNIRISHFNSYEDSNTFLKYLSTLDYTFINYTSSQYYKMPFDILTASNYNCHKVIGQEFDKVAVIIDNTFYYDGTKLASKGWKNDPYKAINMLYQALTRVRKELYIIFINNNEVCNKALDILEQNII